MLLGPKFWKGQQHVGESAEIHARHLRSLCEMVPSGKQILWQHNDRLVEFDDLLRLYIRSDPREVDATPGNMVLFVSVQQVQSVD